ncbi:MAG TPA: hypothetical protein VMH89_09780, partial [Candidatus Acidoferrum sp.]|nr:hypothetical protein [Candidatus Acidoferrum sp.]
YHLVHITLLNALGSATGDSDLLWYRDHWNSFGSGLEPSFLWLQHLAIWLLLRHTALLIPLAAFLLLLAAIAIRSYWRKKSGVLLPATPSHFGGSW